MEQKKKKQNHYLCDCMCEVLCHPQYVILRQPIYNPLHASILLFIFKNVGGSRELYFTSFILFCITFEVFLKLRTFGNYPLSPYFMLDIQIFGPLEIHLKVNFILMQIRHLSGLCCSTSSITEIPGPQIIGSQ